MTKGRREEVIQHKANTGPRSTPEIAPLVVTGVPPRPPKFAIVVANLKVLRSTTATQSAKLRPLPHILPTSHALSCQEDKLNNEECIARPGDGEKNSVDEHTRPIQEPLVLPALCKVPNSCLGMGHCRLDQFTEGIASASILDLKQNTQLIRSHLQNGMSINMNLGFVHFLTHINEDDHTVNIIYIQEHDTNGRQSSYKEQESSGEDPWPLELRHTAFHDYDPSTHI